MILYLYHNSQFWLYLFLFLFLSKEVCFVSDYLWLHCLTNKLDSFMPLQQLGQAYQNHKDDPEYQNYMNILIRGNRSRKGADNFMCDALYELFAEELVKRDQQGYDRGVSRGLSLGMDRLSSLVQKLIAENRSSEIAAVTSDPEYRDKLLLQYHLLS